MIMTSGWVEGRNNKKEKHWYDGRITGNVAWSGENKYHQDSELIRRIKTNCKLHILTINY